MHVTTRIAALVAGAIALVALATAAGGCGSGGSTEAKPSPQWEKVVSTQVSGAKPVKQLLGTYHLSDRVRLAWDLSGPEAPPVMITLRVVDVGTGTGFGASLSPKDSLFALQTENAITLGPIKSADYRIYFSQRFPPARGPGYDVKLTIYTLR
jgi:hypothetical protein